MIQQNAGASEEMAATAEELNSQAEQLSQAIGFFKLSSGSGIKTASNKPRTAAPLAPSPQARVNPKPAQPRKRSAPALTDQSKGVSLDMSGGSDDEFESF
ncbi:hypothetical protein ACQZV8_13555 [Magnetococcales bacterium HHB-1]